MPLAPEYFTADMVRAIPEDGKRYELVWGDLLVSPAPALPHQIVVGNLFADLRAYCARHDAGRVLMSPADISWSDDTLVQPDVFVVDPSESRARDWRSIKTLRLVVEVLSPSTARHDRFSKRKLYQAQRVETLWLVDVDRRVVETWTPSQVFPTVEAAELTWQPAGAPEPIKIPLATLFD